MQEHALVPLFWRITGISDVLGIRASACARGQARALVFLVLAQCLYI